MNTEPLPADLHESAILASRPLLADASKTAAVRSAIVEFGQPVVAEVQAAVARDPIVVVGMAQNPHVKRVRRMLGEAKLAFTDLEYGSYFSRWQDRLAIKLWSGWPTFPQVFVGGTLIGGASDTARALEDGSLKKLLNARPGA